MMKSQANTTDTTAGSGRSVAVEGKCNNCDSKAEMFLLHHVRLRSAYRRLCTSCVLRHNPSSFCPICFSFYDTAPPPKRHTCSKCNSFTHLHCFSATNPTSAPYLCPPCSDPSFVFFRVGDGEGRVVDKSMAAVWLCAAKISNASMANAAAAARADAERKVREATVSRKKAREALEIVAEKFRRREFEERERDAGVLEVSGNANAASVEVKKKEPITTGGGGGGAKVVVASMKQQQPPQQQPQLRQQQPEVVKKVEDDLLEGFDSWSKADGKTSSSLTVKGEVDDSTDQKQNAP